jgi:hypothetical protein
MYRETGNGRINQDAEYLAEIVRATGKGSDFQAVACGTLGRCSS